MSKLASFIDHTLLKATTSPGAVDKLCAEALEYRFATVCINPCYVSRCRSNLMDSGVGITTVIGFPLGASKSAVKVNEALLAIKDGATEIDMVMNIGRFLAGDHNYVADEIAELAREVTPSALLKVIIETAYLSAEQVSLASRIVQQSGADFVKTSTGFASGGASVEHIRLMRAAVGPSFGVKASGGISNRETALAMIEAGANRLGASAGVAIVKGEAGEDNY